MFIQGPGKILIELLELERKEKEIIYLRQLFGLDSAADGEEKFSAGLAKNLKTE